MAEEKTADNENPFFTGMLKGEGTGEAFLALAPETPGGLGKRVLIISDFHMGIGRGDDLEDNGQIVIWLLEHYYFRHGYTLVLNGDIEELAKFSLQDIQRDWKAMYRVFDLFAADGRLFKTLGNHDEDLLYYRTYPYPLYNVVKIDTGCVPLFIYHGHQASQRYMRYSSLINKSLKIFLKPFGIRNISSARNPFHRFYVERQAYNFSLEHNVVSIIGHTHRPLFESLGRFDYIKFEIERLIHDYPSSAGEKRERIAREVEHLRVELGKLGRSEKRNVLRQSLYGDDLPVPCLFNSGCAIGKKGIHAIEVDCRHDGNKTIDLVYWFIDGHGMKFIDRGWYKVERYEDKHGNVFCRSVLNKDKLEYVKAKIELLGKQDGDS